MYHKKEKIKVAKSDRPCQPFLAIFSFYFGLKSNLKSRRFYTPYNVLHVNNNFTVSKSLLQYNLARRRVYQLIYKKLSNLFRNFFHFILTTFFLYFFIFLISCHISIILHYIGDYLQSLNTLHRFSWKF